MEPTKPSRRGGTKAARRQERAGRSGPAAPLHGGSYAPLRESDIERIHRAALRVLDEIGLGDPVPELVELACARGARVDERGRLRFPPALVEDILAGACRGFTLCGQDPVRDVELAGSRVHYATAGMAVRMIDLETGRYRPSTLRDLYDCARLVDRLDNIDIFGRTVVATDIEDLLAFDLSVAYACAAGTTKPIAIGFNRPEHVASGIAMLDAILGGEGHFRQRPFALCNACAIVPPLRFGEDNTTVAMAAARAGMPVNIIVAAQAGATAPAALAGTLVQTVAETLAGLAMVNLAVPGAPVLFGNWPFVSDLRTGAFSGGGGEEAVLNAAAAQIARWFGLPGSVAAGMTDSKEPDAQWGYEKGMTDLLAGLAGGNVVFESAGMSASLLGCSFEGLVLDNEMLAAARRAIRGIEVTEDTLSLEVIRESALAPGHYLGHPQTLALMTTEYVYPEIADRTTPDDWEGRGSPALREKARDAARRILAGHFPDHIDPATDAALRAAWPLLLPPDAMRPAPEISGRG